jgi:hypothetical protein
MRFEATETATAPDTAGSQRQMCLDMNQGDLSFDCIVADIGSVGTDVSTTKVVPDASSGQYQTPY